MSGAAERYRDVRKLPEAPAPISHPAASGEFSSVGNASTSTTSSSTGK